jgi:hypothetical protein
MLLRRRGETVDRLVVPVQVSARVSRTPSRLGSQVGVMPVAGRMAAVLGV